MYYDEGEKMEDIVVKVDHISKSYRLYDKPVDRLKESWGIGKKCYHKDHFALKDINFEVKRGECLGIIGTNGSGKSTLLKIITGEPIDWRSNSEWKNKCVIRTWNWI